MKTRLTVVLTGLACLLAASVASRAAVGVSFSAGIEIGSANDFYEPLTPYGEWGECRLLWTVLAPATR